MADATIHDMRALRVQTTLAVTAVILCTLPLFTFAENIPAGFAPSSLWLSTTNATAGEKITVYTVLYNSSSATFASDVEFRIDGAAVETVRAELAPGTSKIVSYVWSAQAGEHAFSAAIKGGDALASTHSATTTITVAPVEPSPLSQVTQTAAQFTTAAAPIVKEVSQTIVQATESFRAAGTRYLADALYDATSSPATGTAPVVEGQILGTQIQNDAPDASTSILSRIKTATLSALLTIFRSAFYFYPFFGIAFFILLYMAKRAFGGRS